MSFPLTVANFFKSILLPKKWRGWGELLLKNVQQFPPTNHVIAQTGITLSRASWHFGIFAIFFCQIQVKTKKKSYPSARPLALGHGLNPSLVIAFRS